MAVGEQDVRTRNPKPSELNRAGTQPGAVQLRRRNGVRSRRRWHHASPVDVSKYRCHVRSVGQHGTGAGNTHSVGPANERSRHVRGHAGPARVSAFIADVMGLAAPSSGRWLLGRAYGVAGVLGLALQFLHFRLGAGQLPRPFRDGLPAPARVPFGIAGVLELLPCAVDGEHAPVHRERRGRRSGERERRGERGHLRQPAER